MARREDEEEGGREGVDGDAEDVGEGPEGYGGYEFGDWEWEGGGEFGVGREVGGWGEGPYFGRDEGYY